jgi:hypothetical protein
MGLPIGLSESSSWEEQGGRARPPPCSLLTGDDSHDFVISADPLWKRIKYNPGLDFLRSATSVDTAALLKMALPPDLLHGTTPHELEFIAAEELVTVVPTFSMERIRLMSVREREWSHEYLGASVFHMWAVGNIRAIQAPSPHANTPLVRFESQAEEEMLYRPTGMVERW